MRLGIGRRKGIRSPSSPDTHNGGEKKYQKKKFYKNKK
jgi:hypothetical protein